jgi:monovalent cation:H+ antiporter-2, CPA2 family
MQDLFVQLMILMASATVTVTACYFLKIPSIVSFILTGVLIGPHGLALIYSVPGAELITNIGIILLMFSVGLEFSRDKIAHLKESLFKLGISQTLLTILVFTLLYHFIMGFSWPKAYFVACLIAVSCTAMVIQALEQRRELETPQGNAVFGILLAQDLLVIPMMLSIPIITGHTDGTLTYTQMLYWLGMIVGVFVVIFVLNRFVIDNVFKLIAATKSREIFFFAVVLLCFGTASLMNQMGLSLSFGAFVAGLLIAESAYAKQATADVLPMRNNFLGLFFASVGMLIDVRFFLHKAHWIILTLIVIFIVKLIITYSISRYLRYTKKTALTAAIMLFQLGEFSFVLASLGLKNALLSPEEFQFFMAVCVGSLILTPFVIDTIPFFTRHTDRLLPDDERVFKVIRSLSKGSFKHTATIFQPIRQGIDAVKPNVLVIGYGVVGRSVAKTMAAQGIPYSVVDQNFGVISSLKREGVLAVFGDATKLGILEAAGLEWVELVVISISDKTQTPQVIEQIKNAHPKVHIIVRYQYERELKEMKAYSGVDVVVAEHETALALIYKSLKCFGIEEQELDDIKIRTRQDFLGIG